MNRFVHFLLTIRKKRKKMFILAEAAILFKALFQGFSA